MAKGRIAVVAEADLVVEAVFEDEAVKRALWAELDRLAPGRAIFTSNTARTKVEGCVEIGRREGELVCGGRAATGAGLDAGAFFEPTIFTDVPPMARIAQEEIFGPVLSVIPVADYEAAVRAANQTRHGLSSSIYAANVEHGAPRDARPRNRAGLCQRRHDRRRDAPPVRRLEGDRQRPPRGAPRRPGGAGRVRSSAARRGGTRALNERNRRG